jgi:hypothetical protein
MCVIWVRVVAVVRPGFYFVCGGGSPCWSTRVCLPLGVREGGGLWPVGLYEGVKDCARIYGLVFV